MVRSFTLFPKELSNWRLFGLTLDNPSGGGGECGSFKVPSHAKTQPYTDTGS